MINRVKIFCVLLTCLILLPNAHGQDVSQCEQNLENAYKEYESGQFAICVALLDSCASQLNTSSYEAYRLLALSYLELYDDEKAGAAVKSLLKVKPDYKTYPMFDPVKFDNLLDKYDVWPGLYYGIRTNINVNSIRIIQGYSVSNTDATYYPKSGYQTGLNFEYFLKRRLSVGLGFCIEGLTYSKVSEDILGWKQDFTEKLTYWSLPITANYYLEPKASWTFGFELGLQPQFLYNTNSSVILSRAGEGSVQNTMSQKDQRNKTQLIGLAGISAKRNIGQGTFVTGIRLGYGLSQMNDADKRYDNLNFILDNQTVDSDIAFMPAYVMFGYQWSLSNMYKVERLDK